MSLRDRKRQWIWRARILMAIELSLSLIFDLSMIGAVKKGQMLNCLLIAVITINLVTAARLFLKLRGVKCASSIMAYVIWKIVQEVVMIPALVLFSFICVDRFLRSWENINRAVQILVIVWSYAIYSLFLIIFLSWLARFLWQLQARHCASEKSENATTISFIDSFYSEADQHQLVQVTNRSSAVVSNEALELTELPNESNRLFALYDHAVPQVSG